MYIHMHMHIYEYTHVYVCRERERERVRVRYRFGPVAILNLPRHSEQLRAALQAMRLADPDPEVGG